MSCLRHLLPLVFLVLQAALPITSSNLFRNPDYLRLLGVIKVAADADVSDKSMENNQQGDFKGGLPLLFYTGNEREVESEDQVFKAEISGDQTTVINLPDPDHQHVCGIFISTKLSNAVPVKIRWKKSRRQQRYYSNHKGTEVFTMKPGLDRQFILLDPLRANQIIISAFGPSEKFTISLLEKCRFRDEVEAECSIQLSSASLSHKPISYNPIRVICKTSCNQQRLLFGFGWYSEDSSVCYAYKQMYGDFPRMQILNVYKFANGSFYPQAPPDAELTHSIVSYNKILSGGKKVPAFTFERYLAKAASGVVTRG